MYERERERERERETDRQTDRHTDTQTHRQRQTNRQIVRQMDIARYIFTYTAGSIDQTQSVHKDVSAPPFLTILKPFSISSLRFEVGISGFVGR